MMVIAGGAKRAADGVAVDSGEDGGSTGVALAL